MRLRRVNPETWDNLERVAKELGTSRMVLLRCCLTLLADRYKEPPRRPRAPNKAKGRAAAKAGPDGGDHHRN